MRAEPAVAQLRLEIRPTGSHRPRENPVGIRPGRTPKSRGLAGERMTTGSQRVSGHRKPERRRGRLCAPGSPLTLRPHSAEGPASSGRSGFRWPDTRSDSVVGRSPARPLNFGVRPALVPTGFSRGQCDPVGLISRRSRAAAGFARIINRSAAFRLASASEADHQILRDP